ncbi:hypothetical protein GCM10007939_10670 [Amylibacter marinus]|uniref:Uncharacterized protein n=1 Tax=Amylibacter marinus TaxID=1475483 RepID=A0ABQ5VUF3_9RHOB|nr:hypothetical protein GCM10007939_10670 [Amylibacter marinus]
MDQFVIKPIDIEAKVDLAAPVLWGLIAYVTAILICRGLGPKTTYLLVALVTGINTAFILYLVGTMPSALKLMVSKAPWSLEIWSILCRGRCG